MNEVFNAILTMIYFITGGTPPASTVTGYDGLTAIDGIFGTIWDFMIAQPILLIGVAALVLGMSLKFGKRAIGMIKGA
jgi:hypothetical protein